MKVDVYDFDKTIYNGDSSVDFFKFCLKKNKRIILFVPKICFYYFLYFFKIKSKKEVKQVFFSFLKTIHNIEFYIEEFWNINEDKIKKFYLDKVSHNNDIIISASPEFLLNPIGKKLGVLDLIASNVDKHNGIFLGDNCKGEEKIIRLNKKYKDIIVNSVYTDSYSDKPLMDIAIDAYLVKGENIKKIK